jgi:hypothetical protein
MKGFQTIFAKNIFKVVMPSSAILATTVEAA